MEGNKIAGKKVTEEELLAQGYRKYSGKGVDIFYNKDICAHVGNCVRGNAAVFEVGRRPWILADNGEAQNSAEVIDTCPTGALKYIRKDV
ncbi:(4Fe-4S)-binding protein [Enterococcus nangangensis]